jgi:hypothetical protein
MRYPNKGFMQGQALPATLSRNSFDPTVLASQMEVDCQVRAQARRHLKRLDPTFCNHFDFRYEMNR